MIYTIIEYSEIFLFKGKRVSPMTIKRRCEKGMLPSGHVAKKLPGKTGDWLIEVEDQVVEPIEEPVRAEPKTMSRRFYNFK